MRSYLSLIPISAKVHSRRNRMTFFCIVMAVFLVTGVFSIADAGIEADKRNTMATHGNWHINVKDLTYEEMDALASRPDVEISSRYEVVNAVWTGNGFPELGDRYTISGYKTALCGVEQPFLMDMMYYFDETAVLDRADQIILSVNAKRLLGIEAGDSVTLMTPVGSVDFTVTGFRMEGRFASSNGGDESALPVKEDEISAFIQESAFLQLCAQESRENIYSSYYLRFKKGTNITKSINGIKEQFGKTEDQIGANNILLMTMGYGRSSYMANIYGIAAFLFVLILLAGVFMISGSLNSNIAERSQFFGMMRCIGASKRQIIRFVRMEALNWCRISIPLGIFYGTVASWLLCAAIRYAIGGEFQMMPVIRISVVGVLSGVLVGLMTVLLAAQAPAKRAARVSPVAAVSGNTGEGKKIHHVAHTRVFRIDTALGIHHAVSAKKNLFLMTCSFALSIILFLCFSVLIDFFQLLMPYKTYSSDLSIVGEDDKNMLDVSWIEQLEALKGVKEAYGRASVNQIPASFSRELSQNTVNLISYDELQLKWLTKDGDLRKGSDASKVMGDSRYILTIYDKSNPLQVGDKVWIDEEELEIAGVLKNSPFSNDGTTGGEIDMIVSYETCVRLTGESRFGIIDIHATKDITEEEVDKIRDLATEHGCEFADRREEGDRSYFYAFVTIVYGFLWMIAMISALNIINSISMSVSARTKQYGAMRAVGMDGRQLKKMIAAEAYTYAGFGCAAGCGIGLPVSKAMYDFLITDHFGASFYWTLPVGELLVILLLVLAAAAIAVHMPAKRILSMAITETINEL